MHAVSTSIMPASLLYSLLMQVALVLCSTLPGNARRHEETRGVRLYVHENANVMIWISDNSIKMLLLGSPSEIQEFSLS